MLQRDDVCYDDRLGRLSIKQLSDGRQRCLLTVKHPMPPPPIPCTTRPASICPTVCERAQTMLPTAKHTIENSSSSRRPKMSLNDAISGWNTDEKSVMVFNIFWLCYVDSDRKKFKRLTCIWHEICRTNPERLDNVCIEGSSNVLYSRHSDAGNKLDVVEHVQAKV